jgi:hypothetical protein
MDPISAIMLIHYYVMNNSTAMNLTSMPGLMRYENTALGGFFGAGILFALFVIITASLSYIIDFINGVMIASFVATGLSIILALPGIDIVSANVIYIFVAILGVSVLGNLLRGATSTW